ncbi:hypothetical protein DVH05_002113 [Phytophthora capsici]|nr:hypothetical protein DVH05_002113 [Phytophthora capsici]
MRLSFVVLLVATISSLVATSHALPHEQSTVLNVAATNPDQSVTEGQTSEKRFLRSASLGSQLLRSETFKKSKFKDLLDENVSSFTFFVDMLKGKKKYRGIYNEYAAYRKAHNAYP